MNMKKLLLGSLVVGAALALTRKLFAKPASAKPVSNSTSYDAIDAYIEGQMRRLNIPGVSLAIVEGDQIVHLRGFGRARPGGEAPTPQTPFVLGSTHQIIHRPGGDAAGRSREDRAGCPGPALPALVPGGGPPGVCPDDRAPPAEPDQRPAHVGRG